MCVCHDTFSNYHCNHYSLNNIAANNTIGITQFRSIRKPKIRFPNRAPPRPKVSDKAAAITLENYKIELVIYVSVQEM